MRTFLITTASAVIGGLIVRFFFDPLVGFDNASLTPAQSLHDLGMILVGGLATMIGLFTAR